jgi:hypothetical protein
MMKRRRRFMGRILAGAASALMAAAAAQACELCAIYSADSARGQSSQGFLFTMSEMFVESGRLQIDGEEIDFPGGDHLTSSITHLVPTWNFSSRVGVSVSVPLVYRSFRRTDVRRFPGGQVFVTEEGTEFGLGDMSLIGRLNVLQKAEMDYAVVVNLLGGVKFPTGDTDRIRDEVEQAQIFDNLVGVPHEDPLGHSLSSVHQHDISAGSGSYDGVLGITANTRWKRWIFNAQFQYYIRTPGESGFEYGDELMVSGGPGAYLLLQDSFTLLLQANAGYETRARDTLLGRKSDRTGLTAWYMGPQLAFTWGEHFAANAGIDIPLRIANNGFQNVPDYRVHGGLSVRF